MSLTTEVFKSDEGTCKIEVSGRLDTNTAKDFDDKIASVSVQDYPVMIVDLKNLEYVSSAGVRSLFKARKRAKEADGNFLLVNPQPQVKKVFDIIKALPSQSIFASEAEMDDYLDMIQRNAKSS